MTTYKRRKSLSKTWIHAHTHLTQCGRCGSVRRVLNADCPHHEFQPLICDAPCGACLGVHPAD